MNNKYFRLIPIALLTGCASYQATPLPADHPASPGARESVTTPARSSLGTDATTRATRERLAAVQSGRNASPPAVHDMEKMDMRGKSGDAVKAKSGDVYACPMHPEVHEPKPGNCPICGMKLVKKQPEAGHESH